MRFDPIKHFVSLVSDPIKMSWAEVWNLLSDNGHGLHQLRLGHDRGPRKDPNNLLLAPLLTIVNNCIIVIICVNDVVIDNVFEIPSEEFNLAGSRALINAPGLTDYLLSLGEAPPRGLGEVPLDGTLLVALDHSKNA